MAGQGPSRRELLEALGLASAASVCAGFSRWTYALAEPSSPPGHKHLRPAYQPQFFSLDQYRTIEILADLIIPATHDAHRKTRTLQPGARQAGVAEFIDFMVFSDPTLQPPFKSGLAWLDQASVPVASFPKLAPAAQTVILDRIAYKAKFQAGEKPGQDFFRLMRKYTVIGFYTSRIGLESLDYPGLTFYGTSPGCTHDGNPEHVGL